MALASHKAGVEVPLPSFIEYLLFIKFLVKIRFYLGGFFLTRRV